MGWLGDKWIKLHPWGLKIKLHKFYSLWSTLEYWSIISYLPKLPKLGDDTCQQLIGWKTIEIIFFNKSIIINLINLINNVAQVFGFSL